LDQDININTINKTSNETLKRKKTQVAITGYMNKKLSVDVKKKIDQ